MITDITEKLIQKTIDEGGKVYAFNDTLKIEVVAGNGNELKFASDNHPFAVGETIRFLYEPLFKSPYETMLDTDGDGIIDQFDLDADGDGVWDERAPDEPSKIVLKVTHEALAPSDVELDISPVEPDTVRTREIGKALIVDRYYPLYITEEEALEASPLATPDAHAHYLDDREYWMPEGVDQWHGNYHTCIPDEPTILEVVSVETYDFEYVDRVYGQTGFNSIIPRDYNLQLLGIDTDENGTFESITEYFLDDTYNVGEEYHHNYYKTIPEQAWTYKVISRRPSEDVLPAGHSFRLSNYVYELRLTTKFDIGTNDNDQHTLSVFKYLSQLANGSNADFDTLGGGFVRYVDYNDQWQSVVPLEFHESAYIVMDHDLFDVDDELYIHSEIPPFPPSGIRAVVESVGGGGGDGDGDGNNETVPANPSNVTLEIGIVAEPSFVELEVGYYPDEPQQIKAHTRIREDQIPSNVNVGILPNPVSDIDAFWGTIAPNNIEVLAQVQRDVYDVEAKEIFTPDSMVAQLDHWYDASTETYHEILDTDGDGVPDLYDEDFEDPNITRDDDSDGVDDSVDPDFN